ncbi:hypothetical protein [uncultured Friedmanniella sp.]|uniref:hypothetical protein n=1 Tax=uncultured Friedmanniella sp. TaxID=335381 RepID=UPI0035C9AB66
MGLARLAPVPRTPSVGGRTVVQAWLASRGLVALVALVLAVREGRSVTDMVSNWDVQHFTRLAEGGYGAEPDNILMAFFPGLPALLAAGLAVGVPVAVGGVLLSLACSGIAAAALARLGGPWAAVIWLFAPTAVFTTVPYTESLFCAVAFWAWERARADRWGAAALLATAACTVRVSGLFLIGALGVMVLTAAGLSLVDRLRRGAWLLLPAAAILGFAAYLHALTGSWTAWYTAQSTGWVRQLTTPWQSFLNTVPAIVPGAYADHPWWAAVFRGEMVSMAVGLAVTVWCLSRRLWAEAAWVGVQVLAFSLSYWFFSVNRATLLWFPLWIMLARWGTRQPSGPLAAVLHRASVVLGFGLSVVALVWWCWLFFTGHWAS